MTGRAKGIRLNSGVESATEIDGEVAGFGRYETSIPKWTAGLYARSGKPSTFSGPA